MKKSRRHCQSFTVLVDGELVQGRGQFTGPITERDREAIAEVVRALKKVAKADKIESVTLTKADP